MSISRSPHRPVHFYVQDGCYFVTAAIMDHQPLMAASTRREWFTDLLVRLIADQNGELVAWVILPTHYHAILRVREAKLVSQLIQRLHRLSAAEFNREDAALGRQVWYSYWDRCLWTEGDLWSRINYIHWNPVRHGYVAAPADWPHSSWSHFAELDPESEAAIGLKRFSAPRRLPNDP